MIIADDICMAWINAKASICAIKIAFAGDSLGSQETDLHLKHFTLTTHGQVLQALEVVRLLGEICFNLSEVCI